MRRNIRWLAPQRIHFFRGSPEVPLLLRLLVDQAELLLLASGALLLPVLHLLPRLRRHLRKPLRRFRRGPAELSAAAFHLPPLAQTFVAIALQPGLLRLQVFDAVAAQFAMLLLQVVQRSALIVQRRLVLFTLRSRAGQLDL